MGRVDGTIRRDDELDDKFETCMFAWDGSVVDGRRNGKRNGAEWVERCADSGRCDEVAG